MMYFALNSDLQHATMQYAKLKPDRVFIFQTHYTFNQCIKHFSGHFAHFPTANFVITKVNDKKKIIIIIIMHEQKQIQRSKY